MKKIVWTKTAIADLDNIHHYIAPQYEEVHNKWNMAKDGKTYWSPKKYGECNYFKRMMRK